MDSTQPEGDPSTKRAVNRKRGREESYDSTQPKEDW